MRIDIVCVGKLKERYWRDACDEYLKRLGPYADVRILEVPDRDPARYPGSDVATGREAEDILARIDPSRDARTSGARGERGRGERTHVILLAIDGAPVTSEGISKRLDDLALASVSHIAFVIGGSLGVARSVRERADESWSFGAITLPHNLARVVLLEQVYRAFRISRNEPYHK